MGFPHLGRTSMIRTEGLNRTNCVWFQMTPIQVYQVLVPISLHQHWIWHILNSSSYLICACKSSSIWVTFSNTHKPLNLSYKFINLESKSRRKIQLVPNAKFTTAKYLWCHFSMYPYCRSVVRPIHTDSTNKRELYASSRLVLSQFAVLSPCSCPTPYL